MTAPTISVVIPCHDAERYLAQAVGSALDQELPPHEVIVVDDASEDGSLALARRLAAGAPGRVRVLSVFERSAAAARNAGAAAATGDALMFLDADDVLAPDALRGLAAALARRPNGVAMCSWYRLAVADGRWIARPPSSPARGPGQDPLSAWLCGWYHPPCSVLWSREAFERAGRWDDRVTVNDDGDLVLRALALGIPLVQARTGAALYRRLPPGETSLSAEGGTPHGLSSRLHVLRKLAHLLEDRGRLRRYRRPLRLALSLLATEARGNVPEIADQADELGRRFTGAPGASCDAPRSASYERLLAVHRSLGRANRRAAARLRAAHGRDRVGADVRHGLDEAARVLERAQDRPPADVERLHLPLVTVIIPTYNRALLLPRAISSVLKQTMSDLELLVVDDGSTDGTAAVVRALGDRRIRYLPQANAGVAAARNRGMREARGELVAFLDSDDEWSPHKLARQVACLQQAPAEVGLVYTGTVDDDGQGGLSVKVAHHRGDLSRVLMRANVLHGGGSNVLIRRRVVATVGFFDETLPAIEDYDYWLRAAQFFHVEHVAEPLAHYHDPRGGEDRRSRALRQNLAARAIMHRKHRASLRAAGLEAEFLLETARRHLLPPVADARGARWVALRVLAADPGSAAARRVLLRSLVPSRLRRRRAERRARHLVDEGRLRVLLWSSTRRQDRGGVQAVYRDLAAGLRAQGHEVVEAWHEPGPGHADMILPLHLPRRRRGVLLPWTLLPALRSSVLLGLTLLRRRPDVVNVHFVSGAALHFLGLRRLLGYRLVLSAHGSDVLRPLPRNAAHLPRLLRGADAVTAVTPIVAERIRAQPGFDPAKLHVIPNGVDLTFWCASQEDQGDRPPVVLALGRLLPVKGFDVLIAALQPLRKRVPGARVVVAGEGELAEELAELAARLGVGDAVTFPGHLSPVQVRELMATARVFALPSRSEGMPLSLLEAMAAGVPAVATAVGGVPDLVADGSGMLVPPDDPEALAEALASILLDEERARSVAARGQAKAAEHSLLAVTLAYDELFRRLTAAP